MVWTKITEQPQRQVKERISFKNGSEELIKNITFRKIRNTFQDKLKDNIKLIKESNKTMTFADNISNIHQLTKEQYDQIIMNFITCNYKKANNNIKRNPN